jgi:hypothetical protein
VRADYYLAGWILAWGARQLRAAPWHLFDANILYPFPLPLAFAEHLLAGALLVLPVDLLAADPILDHNALVLASFVLGATGTALLVRELGGSPGAAIAAGALWAFNPLRVSQLGQAHLLATHWLPLALLALHRALRTGTRGARVAFAAALFLALAGSVYYAYFFALAVAVFLMVHRALRCPAAPGAWSWAVVAALVAALGIVPLLLPYREVSGRLGLARDPNVAVLFSAVGDQYLGALLSPLRTLRWRYLAGHGDHPLLGLGTLLLAGLGLVRGARPDRGGRRVAAAYALVLVAMALVSLGPRMRLHATLTAGLPGPWLLLATLVPGFDALRVPYRAAAPAVLAACVLAGLGIDALVRRRGPARAVVGLGVGLVVLAECWPPAFHLHDVPPRRPLPAAYRWLAAQPGDFPVVELPIGISDRDGWAMLRSLDHHKRIMNGHSGFSPAGAYTRQTLSGFPDAPSLRLLANLRVRYALLHLADLQGAAAGYAARGAPWVVPSFTDGDTCVLEIRGAPPPAPRPADRPLRLAGARLATSSGDDASAAVDGDLATHWVQPVVPGAEGWIDLDLGAPHVLSRLLLHLGPHYAEYPRRLQVAVSEDGERWRTIADEPIAAAPLAALLHHPDDLTVDIDLPPARARRIRIVRPTRRPGAPWDLYADWVRWGIHEIEVREPPENVPATG